MSRCKLNELVMYSSSAEARSNGAEFTYSASFRQDQGSLLFFCEVEFNATGVFSFSVRRSSVECYKTKTAAEEAACDQVWKRVCEFLSELANPFEDNNVSTVLSSMQRTRALMVESGLEKKLVDEMSALVSKVSAMCCERKVDKLVTLLSKLGVVGFQQQR